jgi:ribosome-associated protein
VGEAALRITPEVALPRAEISYRASRSGGPGGQHVNTASTRIELSWNVADSPSLSAEQRARVLTKLANRISSEGVLSLAESGSRSQLQNREVVIARFQELLRQALHVPKRRKKTRPTRASREARLRAKRRRSQTKRLRRPVEGSE